MAGWEVRLRCPPHGLAQAAGSSRATELNLCKGREAGGPNGGTGQPGTRYAAPRQLHPCRSAAVPLAVCLASVPCRHGKSPRTLIQVSIPWPSSLQGNRVNEYVTNC